MAGSFRNHKFSSDPLEPRFFPKNQATGLAPAMPFPITPYTLQMDGVRHAANTPWLDIVASFIGTLPDAKALAAQTQHLGHEWEMLGAAARVECI